MTEQVIDTNDMYVIHDCLRHEFGRLPITVKAVRDGDSERAAVVGNHALFMADVLHIHHTGEDAVIWPALRDRAPQTATLVVDMEAQHERLNSAIDRLRAQAEEWMADPTAQKRAALHTTLIATERELLGHLAVEEQYVLPLMEEHLSLEEYLSIGEHARSLVPPAQMPIVLGLMLDNTSSERGEVMLAAMPPEAVAGYEQFGRPVYGEYKAALTNY